MPHLQVLPCVSVLESVSGPCDRVRVWIQSLPQWEEVLLPSLHGALSKYKIVGTLILPFPFHCDLLQPQDPPLFTEMKVFHLHNDILPV